MNPFNIHIPTQVRFGEYAVQRELPFLVKDFHPTRVLLVTDAGVRKAGIVEPVVDLLTNQDYDIQVFSDVEPDPSVETVHRVASVIQESGVDLLVALGGGSSIDTAKGARVIARQGGHLREYAGLGAKAVADVSAIPLIAIPTTSGTGSEVTFFGVYSDWENNLKVTVTSPYLAPTVAVVDSSLTHSVPSNVTASSGIDVLAHAVEAYVSRVASPFSDALALRSIQLVEESLKTAVFYGNDQIARNQMSEASLLAGIAFNHAYLGLTHAIAAAVSGHAHVPHGVAIGLLLPHVIRFNLPANKRKFSTLVQVLSQGQSTVAEDAPAMVQQLTKDIGIPQRLTDVGVTEEMLAGIAEQTTQSVQLRFNPRPATVEQVLQLLRDIY